MRRTTLLTGLYLALVFLSGLVLGGFGVRLYTLKTVIASNPKTPEEFRRQYVAEMRSRLKLTDQQVTELLPILDETRKRYHELHEKNRPALKAIQNEQVGKIRSILNDGQRGEYEKMRAEREKLRQQSGHH